MSEYKNKISKLCLENFTVFEKACFDFCPGINVLIGANGTGKSHILKILYILLKQIGKIENITLDFIKSVFQQRHIESLIRSGQSNQNAIATIATIHYDSIKTNFEIFRTSSNTIGMVSNEYKNCPASLFCFIPAHEFLSIQEGFISAYNKRELPYDLTCYDLSLALNALPLRRENLTDIQEILDHLERIITGQKAEQKEILTQENGRFYFHLPEGRMDVHIVAEGYRKIATLYYLLRNGSLTKDSILFWDEPETNLNPKLIVQLVDVLKKLAALGMQIFIATHDYLLSYELSLLAEYPSEPNIDIKFFALHKPERTAGVEVEFGRTLAEIENNPILEEFAAHYDRESALFHHREKEEQSE